MCVYGLMYIYMYRDHDHTSKQFPRDFSRLPPATALQASLAVLVSALEPPTQHWGETEVEFPSGYFT